MKTTIALSERARIEVEPAKTPELSGAVVLQVLERACHCGQCSYSAWSASKSVVLTQDQAGVLIFGLEVAAEAAQMAKDRAGA